MRLRSSLTTLAAFITATLLLHTAHPPRTQCDLHTTTDILARPELAAKCSVPFTPANPATGEPATAQCCTSDITLTEFKTLCGKMDAFDPRATSPPS